MNARRIELTLSQERWEQLEAARGHEPRASFIKRALESALSDDGRTLDKPALRRPANPSTADNGPPASIGKSSAPSRAPKTRLSEAQSVKSQADWMLERQRKLNERKS